MADKTEQLHEVFREVLVPLVEADGGSFYLVTATQKKVALHLGGTYSGCPGTATAIATIIEPAIRKIVPKAKITVTSGWSIPEGAEQLTSA